MDDYQFELHGVKFKYRDGSVFRYWDYKTKRNKAWKIVNTIKRKDHLYFEFTTKKKQYSHSIPIKQTSNPVPSSYPNKPSTCIATDSV